MEAAAATHVGARMLAEIEEASLEEILASVRAAVTAGGQVGHGADVNATNVRGAANRAAGPKGFPFAPLDDLVHRHYRATQSAPLAVTGRYLPLLYTLVATLLAPPHNKTVLVVDVEGCFDATRLLECTPFPPAATTASSEPDEGLAQRRLARSDLDHVYVLRPARGSSAHIADTVAAGEQFMLYGAHGSRGREWWGTVVIGSGGGGGGGGLDPRAAAAASVGVTAGYRGWLRVEKEEVRGFGIGGAGGGAMSVEEAMAVRARRQAAVDEAGWVASSVWGGFVFGGPEGRTGEE